MADVQVKGDIEQIGRNLQDSAERIGLPALIKLFKKLFSTVYRQHIEGLQAVKKDGPTAELESMTNLSYDEVIATLKKCQEDGIPISVTEFKKGNEEIDIDFGKRKSLSKMEGMTKVQRDLERYTKFQKTNPNILKKYVQNKIDTLKKEKENLTNQHEGYRYTIIFNKSRMGYMAERLVDIKNARVGVMEDISKENPKVKEVMELVKDKGLDLNNEQIKDFFGEFMTEGTVDVSEFKENYFIHTVNIDDYNAMYKDLKNSGIDYAVKFSEVRNPIKVDSEVEKKVNIWIKSEEIEDYKNLNFLKQGIIQSVGKKKNTNVSEQQFKEKKIDEKMTEVIVPKEELYKVIEKFKGKDYIIVNNEDNNLTLSINENDLNSVYNYEKKRDVAQEKIDELKKDKNIENDISINKDTSTSATIQNNEVSNPDIDIEIEVGEK
ncbi:MAG: hypothetical protein ACLVAK_08350 [Clostridia bacterium]|jgi:hypothetical protein